MYKHTDKSQEKKPSHTQRNSEGKIETILQLEDGSKVLVPEVVRTCQGSKKNPCQAIEVYDLENEGYKLISRASYNHEELNKKGHIISHTNLSEDCYRDSFNHDCNFSEEEISNLLEEINVKYKSCPKPKIQDN